MRYYFLMMGLILSPASYSNDLVSGFDWHQLPKPPVVTNKKQSVDNQQLEAPNSPDTTKSNKKQAPHPERDTNLRQPFTKTDIKL